MRITPVLVNGFCTVALIAMFVFPSAGSDAQRVTASRAGILRIAAVVPLATTQRADSVAQGHGSRRTHIAIGAGVGGLIGGAFGGANAGRSKDTGTSFDAGATAAGVALGALIGALWGGAIGAFVPHS